MSKKILYISLAIIAIGFVNAFLKDIGLRYTELLFYLEGVIVNEILHWDDKKGEK